MDSHLNSTGGGHGHKPGCTCPYCMSARPTGEVEMDLKVDAPRQPSINLAHEALDAEALEHMANERSWAAEILKTHRRATISASSLARGDVFAIPGRGPIGGDLSRVIHQPRHESGGVIAVTFRHPYDFDGEQHFGALDSVEVAAIDPDAPGRAPRIYASAVPLGAFVADEDGRFVEVIDKTSQGSMPSDPVVFIGRDDDGIDSEFTYHNWTQIPVKESAFDTA